MNSTRAASIAHPDARRFRAFDWLSAALLSVLAFGALAAQNRSPRTVRADGRVIRLDTTVTVERGTILDVTAGTGIIVVRGWDRSEVEVRAEGDDSEFEFSKSARSVRVEARRITRLRNNDVNIQVRVPLNTRVVVSNTAGDVQVLDVRGEVDANLLNGDLIIRGASGRTAVTNVHGEITASDIDGPIKVQSMSGDITLTDVRGDVDVSSSSGEVSLNTIQAKVVRAEVIAGEIFYDGTLNATGRYEFSTHSGDVHLFFAENTGGTLNLQSFNGSLHSALPLLLQADSASGRQALPGIRQLTARPIALNQQRRLVFGGGGSATVSVTTFNGDVHISRGPRRVQKER